MKNGSSRLMKELWAKKKKKRKRKKKKERVSKQGKKSKILGMRDHVANGGQQLPQWLRDEAGKQVVGSSNPTRDHILEVLLREESLAGNFCLYFSCLFGSVLFFRSAVWDFDVRCVFPQPAFPPSLLCTFLLPARYPPTTPPDDLQPFHSCLLRWSFFFFGGLSFWFFSRSV